MPTLNERLTRYYYAVGYYDGRERGYVSNDIEIPDEFKPYHDEGYWSGVSDYTEYDAPRDE